MLRFLLLLQPLLFALYPAIALYRDSLQVVTPSEMATILAMLAGLGGLTTVAAHQALKDPQRATIAASSFWWLFFSYGDSRKSVWDRFLDGTPLESHLYQLLLWGAAYGAILYLIRRPVKHSGTVATLLGGMGVLSCGFQTAMIAMALLNQPAIPPVAAPAIVTRPAALAPSSIYYIVLDAYGRTDTLQEMYGYDNRWFIEELRRRGFYVATESTANYNQTESALTSYLNATYLDEMVQKVGKDSTDRRPARDMRADSAVANSLKSQGYEYVAYGSGFEQDTLSEADDYRSAPWTPSLLESYLLYSSPLLALNDQEYSIQRTRVLYVFDHLADTASAGRRQFVFAHILSPHPPFIFDGNGDPVNPQREFSIGDASDFIRTASREEYLAGYRRQVDFVSHRILRTIDEILAKSPEPPLIILQGDHGPGSQTDWNEPGKSNFGERMHILNAYLFPEQRPSQLYDSISPVNSFRVVLNHCFSADLPLLPDRSYFAGWSHPYDFLDVTDIVR